MSDNDGIVKNLGLIGLSNILIGFSTFIILPLLTNNLSSRDYGTWVQITVTISMVPTVVMLGMPFTMVRFLAVEKDRLNISDCFYSMLAITAITSLVASLLFFIFSGVLAGIFFSGYADVINVVAVIIFFECMSLLFVSYFRSRLQIKKYTLFSLVKIYVNLAAVAFMVMRGDGLMGAVVGFLVTDVLICLVMLCFILPEIGVAMPSFKDLKRHLRFGLPTIPSNISSWIISASDRYVIGGFLGASFAGYYTTGFMLGNIISMIITPLSFLLPSVLSKYYDENHITDVRVMLERSLKYYLMITIPAVFGIAVLARPMLEALSTPEIASYGYIVAPLVAIGTTITGLNAIISQVFILEKNTGFIAKACIVTAIAYLFMNILLVPVVGISGAGISLIVINIPMLLVLWHYSQKQVRIAIDLPLIAKYALSAAVMSVAILTIGHTGLSGIAISVMAGISVYFLSLLLMRGLRRDEIWLLRQFIKIH
jgi:O-antigen/teichoic acid export membrane protein